LLTRPLSCDLSSLHHHYGDKQVEQRRKARSFVADLRLCQAQPVKPKFHLLRDVATRHDTLSIPHFLAQEKVLTCCAALVGQHGTTRSSRETRLARHVFRGDATSWTGVDMATSLFPKVVPEIDANPEQERLNLYTRTLLLLRRPLC